MAQLTADYLAFDPSTNTATISVDTRPSRVGITLRFTESPATLDLATLLASATAQGIADGLLAEGTTLAWAQPIPSQEAE